MSRLKLAIISTHPIQYYAPVFRALTQSGTVLPRVFFTWSQTAEGPVFDPGFGTAFTWDVPLLDGYDHEFVPNVARHPGSSAFQGVWNPDLNRRITAWGADAVLIYGWNLRSHLAALRHFKGKVPVLFRGDSTLIDARSAFRRQLRRQYLRWVYSHVDLALAVGSNNRDYYLWAGLNEDQITFAPHSVDTVRFSDGTGADARRAKAWRQDLGIPDDKVTFVFAAKFIQKKDPLLLLEAFLRERMTAHLLLFGNGELEPALRERASGHTNVHFLPFQNQQTMPSVYRLGDLYILPSRGPGETWGLALNEAMASGRAMVASSKVGGARDLVQDGITGWNFQSGNPHDLSRVLTSALACGREGLKRMGDNARERSSQWSTEAAAEAIAGAVLRLQGQRV